MMDRETVWNDAGMPGLVLGLVPVACMALNLIKSDSLAMASLLWVVKFGGCIYLLYFFMKKFLRDHDDAGRTDVFRFGVVTALLSAIICSGCQLGYVLLLKPDTYQAAIDTVLNSGMASALDSNSLAEIEAITPKLPTIAFFGNLVYCFLFGLVVSAIISGSIASDNPFDNNE